MIETCTFFIVDDCFIATSTHLSYIVIYLLNIFISLELKQLHVDDLLLIIHLNLIITTD